jgi:site-specific recombinase XerD
LKNGTSKVPVLETLDRFLTEYPTLVDWATKGAYCNQVKRFLYWLHDQRINIEDVDRKAMNRFFKDLKADTKSYESRAKIRSTLRSYFDWLHQQDYPVESPAVLLPYQKARAEFINVKMTPDMERFIDIVSVNLRPNTLQSHKTSLRHLTEFLDLNKIRIALLKREHAEDFFKYLATKRQAPSTRLGNILVVRKYLKWLYDQGKLKERPDFLVRTRDYPRLPDYLPRPIPPDLDMLIQKKLAEEDDSSRLGLLLMRWTGIRVGEMVNLPPNCIHHDHEGHALLKVPIGKLYNERMVPISARVVELIGRIKKVVEKDMRGRQVDYLIVSPMGQRLKTHNLMFAFKEATEHLKPQWPHEHLVTHRLRHTYATELLAAGMNIFALKDILGHRDIRMTLRYAEVTQAQVRKEYFAALHRMEQEHGIQETLLDSIVGSEEHDHTRSLRDLVLEIKRASQAKKIPTEAAKRLTKRVDALRKEIESILQ